MPTAVRALGGWGYLGLWYAVQGPGLVLVGPSSYSRRVGLHGKGAQPPHSVLAQRLRCLTCRAPRRLPRAVLRGVGALVGASDSHHAMLAFTAVSHAQLARVLRVIQGWIRRSRLPGAASDDAGGSAGTVGIPLVFGLALATSHAAASQIQV